MAISKSLRFKVLADDGFKCRYCGRPSSEVTIEVDHITPRSKGGADEASNLAAACFDCNRGKSARHVDEWGCTPFEALEIERDVTDAFLEMARNDVAYLELQLTEAHETIQLLQDQITLLRWALDDDEGQQDGRD